MERGSAKHNPRIDDELADGVRGRLGGHGGHREEWAEVEPRAEAENRVDRTELPREPSAVPADDDEAD
ncbi:MULTISPECIES: hypothetical protein [unclassified Pseudonocardia]|jgi:hypothetical protein|uniref:hypothetical protein n=1 Tax=unclassified Pseudonocardia TaxID=2619320 RepID=UPI003100D038